jgi:hypothetical protein
MARSTLEKDLKVLEDAYSSTDMSVEEYQGRRKRLLDKHLGSEVGATGGHFWTDLIDGKDYAVAKAIKWAVIIVAVIIILSIIASVVTGLAGLAGGGGFEGMEYDD